MQHRIVLGRLRSLQALAKGDTGLDLACGPWVDVCGLNKHDFKTTLRQVFDKCPLTTSMIRNTGGRLWPCRHRGKNSVLCSHNADNKEKDLALYH